MGNGGCSCGCNASVKFIFPCSGAADVGEVADRAARRLTGTGAGKMYCLAGIGGGVSGIIESTKAADAVLVIDGCPVDCGKKAMEKAGIAGFEHFRVTDLGLEKGNTAVTDEHVDKVVTQGEGLLARQGGCCGQ